MFSDPFTAIMALILLAFIGTLAVFFRIWRELDGVRASLRELRETVQLYAVDAAQQNRDLATLVRDPRGMRAGQGGEASPAGGDCLGDLLERGLPNLTVAAPDHGAAAGNDDDVFRSFGNDLDRDAQPK